MARDALSSRGEFVSMSLVVETCHFLEFKLVETDEVADAAMGPFIGNVVLVETQRRKLPLDRCGPTFSP